MMSFIKNNVKITKTKGIVGAVMAVINMVLFLLWDNLILGAAVSLMFLAVGFIRFEFKTRTMQMIFNFLWLCAVSFILFFNSVTLIGARNFLVAGLFNLFLNFLLIVVCTGIVFTIISNWKISVTVTSAILLLLFITNGMVFQFRGTEFSVADFTAARTAMDVVGQYRFKVSMEMILSWSLLVLVIFAQFSIPTVKFDSKIKPRIIALAGAIICFTVVHFVSLDMPIGIWGRDGTSVNGYLLNFYIGTRYISVDEPEGYSTENVDAVANKYKTEEKTLLKEDLPNIVVIMNESYADYEVFGEISANEKISPFIKSLEENTVKGYALTSVYGGTTANPELEFLTGSTMAFFPKHAIPYQQYIENTTFSLAHMLAQMGYETLGTHPSKEKAWSRGTVYPLLGFEKTAFSDDYERKYFVRNSISDRDTYEYVLTEVNKQNTDNPKFVFCVTIQNHGGYEYDGENYIKTVELSGYKKEYPKAEQYFSIIQETDKATEYFIEKIKALPEKTVVLFFGDHLPKIEEGFAEEVYGKPLKTLSEKNMKYTVPFFIWANYDIPEVDLGLTSINYLSAHLLDAAGIDLPPYYRFLNDMKEEIPAINAFGYYSKTQDDFIDFNNATGKEAEALKTYSRVQYNNIFDTKNSNKVFFPKQ